MKVFCGAGEASGDRILAALLRGLRARHPDLELRGFGGALSVAEGLRPSFSLADLAVNGIGDVLRRGAFLLRTRAALLRELEAFRPDLVLLVDYPGMNIPLARRARDLGIPVHYVAPPQLWAYRNPARRLRRLRAALEGASLQGLFPFEANAYAPWRGNIAQGHFFPVPAFEPARGGRLLLCPGSRAGVLRRNLPLWLDRVRAADRNPDSIDILVPEYLADDAQAIAAGNGFMDRNGMYGRPAGRPAIETIPPAAFARAGAAIAFPGTITLELLLRRIPTRVWSVLDPPTLWLGRRTLRGPRVALANVLAEREVFPEWIGTARDFRRAAPNLPESLDAWDPVDGDTVAAVWEKMGSDQGVAEGIAACLKLLAAK